MWGAALFMYDWCFREVRKCEGVSRRTIKGWLSMAGHTSKECFIPYLHRSCTRKTRKTQRGIGRRLYGLINFCNYMNNLSHKMQDWPASNELRKHEMTAREAQDLNKSYRFVRSIYSIHTPLSQMVVMSVGMQGDGAESTAKILTVPLTARPCIS